MAATVLSLAACSGKNESGEHSEHAGHNHGGAVAEEEKGHGHGEEAGASKEATGKKMCAEHNVLLGRVRHLQAATGDDPEGGRIGQGTAGVERLGEDRRSSDRSAERGDHCGWSGVLCRTGVQSKQARADCRAGGWDLSRRWSADLGHKVEEKQLVAKIWSAAIAESVAKAVLTHQTLERERKLRADRVTSEKDLQQAEADHRGACQQARTLGLSEEDIDRMRANPNEPVFLEVHAPFAGEIVERTAVRGALVEAGKALFTLVDRSVMWAMLNIPESALGRVKEGQTVELRVESLPGRTFTGKLTWIAAEVDEKSRMARARAEVANPDRVLKANMFSQARILTPQHGRSVAAAPVSHPANGR